MTAGIGVPSFGVVIDHFWHTLITESVDLPVAPMFFRI